METGNSLIPAHSGLGPFYPTITSGPTGLLSSSPSQDSITRPSLTGQNGWPSYGADPANLVHNSCAMSSYPNLQLGGLSMNSKPSYSSPLGVSDYIPNCRNVNFGSLNAMPVRNYLYHPDMYGPAAGHHAAYANGGFYPEMAGGLPPMAGREMDCRSSQGDVSQQEPKGRKKRKPHTRYQNMVLENEFIKNPYITRQQRWEIACKVQMPELRVKVWFQNRRMKRKKLNERGKRLLKDEPEPNHANQERISYHTQEVHSNPQHRPHHPHDPQPLNMHQNIHNMTMKQETDPEMLPPHPHEPHLDLPHQPHQ